MRLTAARPARRRHPSPRAGSRAKRSSVVSTVASSTRATAETRQRASFHQHPSPGAAATSSPTGGKYAAPASTVSSSATAISVPHSGTPRTKLFVPSIGSMIQRRRASGRSTPNSSPSTPSPGKWRCTHSRAAVSAARSATVTGEPSPFVSTATPVR